MTITRNFSILANGAGSANNLSLGGATLGSNALAVTGTAAISGATTAASINFGGSTLSTYAEGTFTPTVAFGGASVGITYLSQVGRYTRIGNVVTVQIYIGLTSKGSSVGAATVSALPYTSNATRDQIYTAQGDTLNLFQVYLAGSSTTLALYTTATVAISNTSFTGSDNIRTTITYLV